MMEKLVEKLKKNTILHFFVKAFKHINEKEYLNFFINRENLPLVLEFETRGNDSIGECIYLIEETGNGFGFFAEFHIMLQKLIFADYFHLKPYVYWGENFLYYERDINNTQNAYEYLFEAINGDLGDKIDTADLLTRSKMGQAEWVVNRYERGYDLSSKYLERAAEVYKKYIRLKPEISSKVQQEIMELLDVKKTLAIHYRGTDFKMNYDNHPVCVTIGQVLEAAKKVMEDHLFERIFLATDDMTAINAFEAEFAGKVVFYHDVLRGDDTTSVAFSKSDRKEHHYLLAYEVLRDMLTLSACEGLIAGVSQVSICARIAKASRGEAFQYLQIIDNGKNYNNKKFKAVRK